MKELQFQLTVQVDEAFSVKEVTALLSAQLSSSPHLTVSLLEPRGGAIPPATDRSKWEASPDDTVILKGESDGDL